MLKVVKSFKLRPFLILCNEKEKNCEKYEKKMMMEMGDDPFWEEAVCGPNGKKYDVRTPKCS